MKRVLVTGGSGFVGANLVRRLLHDGHEVFVLLRDSHQPWRLEEVIADCHAVPANLNDAAAVRAAVATARPDWVFHLAAYGAYSSQTGFASMVAVNLLGAANLIESCAAQGIEFLVNAGSSSEYGYKQGAARESDLLEPNSHYAITKAAATHAFQLAAQQRSLRCATVRLYSIYGPYEEPTRLIPTLLVHALRGRLPPLVSPQTARDFVHVNDAVDGMVRVAQSGAARLVYNIASGTQTTLVQIVEQVRTLLHVPMEPDWGSMEARTWDADSWRGDPAALVQDLGWRASTDLRSGLRHTIGWLQSNPRWAAHYESRILASKANQQGSPN